MLIKCIARDLIAAVESRAHSQNRVHRIFGEVCELVSEVGSPVMDDKDARLAGQLLQFP